MFTISLEFSSGDTDATFVERAADSAQRLCFCDCLIVIVHISLDVEDLMWF